MKLFSPLTLICLGVALLGASCTNFPDLNTYSKSEIGVAQNTFTGTVTLVEDVRVQPNNRAMGTSLGTLAGGLTGGMLGGGNAKFATAAGGALVGAFAGNQADALINNTTGQRITVQLDKPYQYQGSSLITVTQVPDETPIVIGQHVRVLVGGNSARVLPY